MLVSLSQDSSARARTHTHAPRLESSHKMLSQQAPSSGSHTVTALFHPKRKYWRASLLVLLRSHAHCGPVSGSHHQKPPLKVLSPRAQPQCECLPESMDAYNSGPAGMRTSTQPCVSLQPSPKHTAGPNRVVWVLGAVSASVLCAKIKSLSNA